MAGLDAAGEVEDDDRSTEMVDAMRAGILRA